MSDDLLQKFAGCWRLVEYEFRTDADAVLKPWGDDPVGIVMFDRSGRFSAQIMRRDRPALDTEHPSPEGIRDAYLGYIAYFGVTEVNAEEGIIINHVEGALNPNWVGGQQVRLFEIDGDRQVLKLPPTRIGGLEITGTLVWKRES